MIVPKHEPEVVEAYTKKFGGGDDEKSPTTSINEVWKNRISLTSRLRKAQDLEEMARIVDGLPEVIQESMLGIWCDSKRGAWYEITLDDGLDMLRWRWLVAMIRCHFGTHVGCNGGNIVANGYPDKDIAANWPGGVW